MLGQGGPVKVHVSDAARWTFARASTGWRWRCRRSMPARLPVAIAEELDPGAVHARVARPVGAAIRDLNGQGSLPAAQGGKVGHGPVLPGQSRARLATIPAVWRRGSLNTPGLRPFRAETIPRIVSGTPFTRDRQAELDGRIGKHRRPSRPPVTRRAPGHALVDPDRHRPPPAQRRVVAGPVRGAMAGRRWLAHPTRVTAWIREETPLSSEMCNNASCSGKGVLGFISRLEIAGVQLQ